ncbi:MAG: hypothetical protein A3I89_01505 [Candidatus Harrisonbacteria bacterium RIFCSPLOWO2_02_FULL_41_11]|uniref:Uncharacterized protein n=1 Tax=Candidatus Harrisonbacteria bacterium RIFCSPHIGHO2_02_FULL_42_16 TaxID=1798404 RepID=A0A1G1ZFK0_9BACT|nr:MAG: hypothetical protein A3B92_03985 [Candidatus Harrisonbacteria bacterium RIFCSPHIGHO2_02_FULL_42_16]OGY66732.1 MAG: hypothetical protein A3I89_01505 [Candidatus Harrisonbacteria bacterium RIFCSPLOWO2_02_FULL_41_11]
MTDDNLRFGWSHYILVDESGEETKMKDLFKSCLGSSYDGLLFMTKNKKDNFFEEGELVVLHIVDENQCFVKPNKNFDDWKDLGEVFEDRNNPLPGDPSPA